MDFKGPVGGQYYIHVVIDNLSRYPIVHYVKSKKFSELKPKLDDTFSMFGIPESVTHDGGPPYNSEDWRKYAREQGFESRLCTPEHPEGNAIAERFMGVLVKTIHAAKAEGKDPKLEIKKRLMNYRNTPHPATGVAPAELMFRRSIKSKIPRKKRFLNEGYLKEAREKDEKSRLDRKEKFDSKRGTVDMEVRVGDHVLVKQTKTTTKPPFDPAPYIVIEVNGTQAVMERNGKRLKRSFNKIKIIGRKPKDKKERKESREDPADNGKKREKRKRERK